jgi:hypothetical protein
MSDEKLEQLVTEYADLAKDKNIDAASLLMSALQQSDQNLIPQSTKRWAYLISISMPPIGLLFAVWFYISDKSDGKQTAYWCTGLTLVSLFITIMLFKSIFTGIGASQMQKEQINPQEYYQLN